MSEVTNTERGVKNSKEQVSLPVPIKISAYYLILMPILYISSIALLNLSAAGSAGSTSSLGVALVVIFLVYFITIALVQILPTLFLVARKKFAWFILIILLPLKILGFAWLALTGRYQTSDIGFQLVIIDFFASFPILLILFKYKHYLGFSKNE